MRGWSSVGPGDAAIMPRITDQGNGNFRVDYTPTIAGMFTCRPFYHNLAAFVINTYLLW